MTTEIIVSGETALRCAEVSLDGWVLNKIGGGSLDSLVAFVRTDPTARSSNFFAYNTPPSIGQFRANGTPQAPTALKKDDIGFNISIRGYGATGWSDISKGYIRWWAAEDWTDAAQGTRIALAWSPLGHPSAQDAKPYWQGKGAGVIVHNRQPDLPEPQKDTPSAVHVGAAGVSWVSQFFSFGVNPTLIQYRANGALGAETAVQAGNVLGQYACGGYDGSVWSPAAGCLRVMATENWTATSHPTRSAIMRTAPGYVWPAEGLAAESDGSITQGGSVIHRSDRTLQNREYTVATLPAPGHPGRQAYASDCRVLTIDGYLETSGQGSGGLVVDNGTAWRVAGTNINASA